MGLMFSIVSRFRKRATTREVLEGIEEDVKKLDSTLQRNQKLQKKIVLSLLTISICSYLIAVAIFYFFLLPDYWTDRAIWLLPFACFPFLVYLLKKCFHFFFVTRIKKIRTAIDDLNKRKKQILEDVMDNETYKTAKELLEKFDPDGTIIPRETAIKSVPATPRTPSQGELRLRTNAVKTGDVSGDQSFRSPQMQAPRAATPWPGGHAATPRFPINPNIIQRTPYPAGIQRNGLQNPTGRPTTPFQVHPILPMERSLFDKVAEYLIGDGPGYRYALICKGCHGHNGMALKDEFEFIAFSCCYCGLPNPARKTRPNAPTLQDSNLSDKGSDQEKNNEKEGKSEESDLESLNESKAVIDPAENVTKESCSSEEDGSDVIEKGNDQVSEEDKTNCLSD